jgi:DNA-binding NarL/FixJ family response regulator
MWRHGLIWGGVLGLGTLGLGWIDYLLLIRVHGAQLSLAAIAIGFMALGVLVSRETRVREGQGLEPPRPEPGADVTISARELMVLKQAAEGCSNKEIAEKLCVSPHTVKSHLANLYDKLGAKRRTEAIARARGLGLLS